jgi:hypothetical protein
VRPSRRNPIWVIAYAAICMLAGAARGATASASAARAPGRACTRRGSAPGQGGTSPSPPAPKKPPGLMTMPRSRQRCGIAIGIAVARHLRPHVEPAALGRHWMPRAVKSVDQQPVLLREHAPARRHMLIVVPGHRRRRLDEGRAADAHGRAPAAVGGDQGGIAGDEAGAVAGHAAALGAAVEGQYPRCAASSSRRRRAGGLIEPQVLVALVAGEQDAVLAGDRRLGA